MSDIDKDAQVVLTGADADAGSGEFGRDLVKASGDDASLGAVNVKGRDRRMVRGLLGEVVDFQCFSCAS